MSPDSDAVQWLIVILAVIQTVATLVQVTSASKQPQASSEPATLDLSVKVGLMLLPIAVLLVLLAPYYEDGRADTGDSMAVLAILFAIAGPGFAGFAGGYNAASLLHAPTSGSNAVANVTAVAAAILIAVVVASWSSPYVGESAGKYGVLLPGILGFGLGYTTVTDRVKAERKSQDSDSE